MKREPIKLFVVTLSLFVFSVASALPLGSVNRPTAPVDSQLVLGNPSDATDEESNKDNFLMVKPQYVLSYDNTKGGPNWVSWHLQAADIGDEARGDFYTDNTLPAGFKTIGKADYTNSGFDRGHVCNSKDRTDTRENNDATFFMTNILPQAPDNNQGPWVRLENFERTLAQQGNELYIYAGASGTGGTGKNGKKNTIANGEVNVPKTFWKILLVITKGNNDLSRINKNTRTIAICMPNKQGIRNNDWRKFITTINKVEGATGYNFLTALPSNVQNSLETKRDSMATGSASANPCQ
jgi:endonuclease G